jgi:hypothetical protein
MTIKELKEIIDIYNDDDELDIEISVERNIDTGFTMFLELVVNGDGVYTVFSKKLRGK